MDRLSLLFLSVVITGLATYFGGNAFFDSTHPLATVLKEYQLTMHVRWASFFVLMIISFVPLNLVSNAMDRKRNDQKAQ